MAITEHPDRGAVHQPEYEVRVAALDVEDESRPVQIWYRHFYATDDVDVIAISNR